ncbi:MAG: hypothetical protein NTV34_08585 [Proteobacteria bacterium]|nr:hypothetical protein [Pseudomonadota bacterium]
MKLVTTVFVAAVVTMSCAGKNISNPNATLESSKSSVYLVEPMLCGGKIDNRPSSMDPSYSQILMKFVSFKSKRAGGQWVDSLVVSNDYFGPSEKINYDSDKHGEEWFMGPLSISADKVTRKSLSGRNDELVLTVTGTYVKSGKRVQILEGTYSPNGTVVGSYVYNLKCTATVVSEPSRRDDRT